MGGGGGEGGGGGGGGGGPFGDICLSANKCGLYVFLFVHSGLALRLCGYLSHNNIMLHCNLKSAVTCISTCIASCSNMLHKV